MKKNSGFTLLELLLTLALIGIVTAFAVPSMTEFSKNDRLTTNINSMIGHLAYARSEAVKRSVQVAMCVSNDTDTPNPTCTGGNFHFAKSSASSVRYQPFSSITSGWGL